MAKTKDQHLEEARFAEEEAGKRWGQYFRSLVRNWQFAAENGDRIFISRVDLGNKIGVSDATIGKWIDGKAPPSRRLAVLVAKAFNVPLIRVMQEASINPYQDDSY